MKNLKKRRESTLEKCQKCDCYLSADSFDDGGYPNRTTSIHEINRTHELQSNSSSICKVGYESRIILRPTCQSKVKIYVKTAKDDEPEQNIDKCNYDLKRVLSKEKKKRKCFNFCGRTKENKKVNTNSLEKSNGNNRKDNIMHTSRHDNAVTNGNNNEEVKIGKSNVDIKANNFDSTSKISDIVKACCKKCEGTCNTNTIIFPRDPTNKSNGTCLESVQELLRDEARINSKIFDEILCEVCRQRKEIKEIREMLDLFLRMMREHLFMLSAYGGGDNKYKNALHEIDDLRKNGLERKSNTLSINGKTEEAPVDVQDQKPDTSAENNLDIIQPTKSNKKNKKGIFNWCK